MRLEEELPFCLDEDPRLRLDLAFFDAFAGSGNEITAVRFRFRPDRRGAGSEAGVVVPLLPPGPLLLVVPASLSGVEVVADVVAVLVVGPLSELAGARALLAVVVAVGSMAFSSAVGAATGS